MCRYERKLQCSDKRARRESRRNALGDFAVKHGIMLHPFDLRDNEVVIDLAHHSSEAVQSHRSHFGSSHFGKFLACLFMAILLVRVDLFVLLLLLSATLGRGQQPQMGSRGQHPGRHVEDNLARAPSTLDEVG